jgi:dihydropyrimidinase
MTSEAVPQDPQTPLDLVIRGGRVVTEADILECDVGIRDGIIAAIGRDLGEARQVLDATGRLVLPGGIDAHCHLAQRSAFGIMTADDFTSGSVSAACGGTTTIIPFAPQQKGESLRAAVEAYAAEAEGRSILDYGFNLIVSDPTPTVLDEELPALVEQGHTAVKVFMTYDSVRIDDGQLLDVLERTRDLGALTMVHAENHALIQWLTRRLVARGDVAPRFHAKAHAPESEREAVHRVIALAEAIGAPVYVVHLSDADAIDEVRRARARGVPVLGETCPQYLVLTEDDLDRPGFEGAKFVFSPPARPAGTPERVWSALAEGVIQTVHSDHAGYRFDDPQGKKLHGDGAPFHRIPNGVPGLEARLPVVFSEGVVKGRFDLRRFVQLTAENPARIFGLYPRKGVIRVGADADLAVWDPEIAVRLSIYMLHDNMDYTPYEGMEITGWPVTTLSRGRIVWHDGWPRGEPGHGRLLKRTAPRIADFMR